MWEDKVIGSRSRKLKSTANAGEQMRKNIGKQSGISSPDNIFGNYLGIIQMRVSWEK